MVLRACIPSIWRIHYTCTYIEGADRRWLIGGWSFFFVGKAEASLLSEVSNVWDFSPQNHNITEPTNKVFGISAKEHEKNI